VASPNQTGRQEAQINLLPTFGTRYQTDFQEGLSSGEMSQPFEDLNEAKPGPGSLGLWGLVMNRNLNGMRSGPVRCAPARILFTLARRHLIIRLSSTSFFVLTPSHLKSDRPKPATRSEIVVPFASLSPSVSQGPQATLLKPRGPLTRYPQRSNSGEGPGATGTRGRGRR